MAHKKLVFVYIPVLISSLVLVYVLLIYLNWQSDRSAALEKLSRYKQLIDRTEEMKKGYIYSYGDINLSAKVVDLPTRIYDRNNEIIGEFFEEKREIVPYDYIPEMLVKGVIASEDRKFYQHKGINYQGIIRAFLVNTVNFRIVQGGSTITQQLAKVLFTDMERSIKRKIYEAFCALEIETKYDKQDILSMYLNLIYFGKGAYGVESASKMFFGRSVRKLNEVECAMIVAVISSPGSYSPIHNLNNSIRKTRRILKSMVDSGFLNEKRAEYQYEKFLKKWDLKFNENHKAVSSLIGSFLYSSYRINRAPFFNEKIRRVLVNRFGEDSVKKGGLKIYTTLDARYQDIALHSLRSGIGAQRNYHINESKSIKSKTGSAAELEKSKNIEGALIALNPGTGEIISYVGGSDFTSANQVDCVSQIRRQPGSSFKPFVYLSAIWDRTITPSTVFVDEKTVFKGDYSPGNYSHKYRGKIIAREALRKSLNVVTVKVLERTGYDRLFQILSNGLTLTEEDINKRFYKTLSMALGTYEISPLENCTLHSIIANGGDYIKPYGIKFVKDYNNNIVWNVEEENLRYISQMRKDKGKIIDPAAAAVTLCILKGVLKPGGTASYCARSRHINFPAAGKTGTSTNYNDAWFAGYTSELVTVVWMGNKKGAISLGHGRTGGLLAGPVWADYISKVYKEKQPGEFKIPDKGITKEIICLESGEVAGKNSECPDTEEQLFCAGSEPGTYCHIHVNKESSQ